MRFAFTKHFESHSLRSRYLLVSALTALMLLVISLTAYRHISQVAADNTHALIYSERLNRSIGRIREALRAADIAVQNQISDPSEDTQADILSNIKLAERIIASLNDGDAMPNTTWQPYIHQLEENTHELKKALQTFLRLRQDPAWVYPALPFISGSLLEANRGFEETLSLALDETEEDSDDLSRFAVYRELSGLRDLWRRMLLNFRAVMIRFAGLPNVDPSAEEENISAIYQTIDARLQRLIQNKDGLEYGLYTEEAWGKLRRYARDWFTHFQQVKQLRASKSWRGDITYLENVIRPRQKAVESNMQSLEQEIAIWSAKTAQAVAAAATRVNLVLWFVSGFGLLFIVAVYFMLDRGVLAPIARVANALAAEASGRSEIALPSLRNREIATLTEAFEHMRKQIQGRQQALEHQALHDVLTGLPNRALLLDRIEQNLRQIRHHGGELALLLLDLDHFKEVNDTLGHEVGDEVLQQISHRLTALLQDNESVARLGGDEFAILLPGKGRGDASQLAEVIASTINQPIVANRQTLYLGVSIGIVIAPYEGSDSTTLLRHADTAMYIAKHGNQQYAFYDPQKDMQAAESLALIAELRKQLHDPQDLRIFYQPKVDTQSGFITGAEALLRWQTPGNDWISPERIVEAAEHANLIRELTEWVLDSALRDCAQCARQGLKLQIAVNLSARNLEDPDLPQLVRTALDRHQVTPSQLTLEITENAVMADPEHARLVLRQLAAMGIILSIDDFGTGFSSMAHLKLLPVHELKIDKSFVIGMQQNSSDAIIVNATIDLGHNLGLQVVAEGVESHGVFNSLKQRQCDLIQGYLISRPVSLATMLAQIKAGGQGSAALA